MKIYTDYFSEEAITQFLIKERLKRSRRRDQYQKLNQLSPNTFLITHDKIDDELQMYIPPRRGWIRPGPTSRCRHHKNCKRDKCRNNCHLRQNYNSNDMASISLNLTFRKIASNKENQYIKAINTLRLEILKDLSDEEYNFEHPNIIAIPKDIENGVYRPIAQYKLKEKIIISLTNRYFTDLFDLFFHDVSFAFRSNQVDKNHHKAFDEILEYNSFNKNREHLWVSECDIQKFYDTVNHSIIKREFDKLIKKTSKSMELQDFLSIDAQRIFYTYLKSYSFNKNVKELNSDSKYWKRIKGPSSNKYFAWIPLEILKGQYKRIGSARIGVPQGGALSGLIANIVLNTADEEIIKASKNDIDLCYVRFCDDIVIIHSDYNQCSLYYQLYYNSLISLKLFPHSPCDLSSGYTKKFWKDKTKLNYCWSKSSGNFPWLGFVGYEVNRFGHVRVRKKSIQKEIEKQRKWITTLIGILRSTEKVDNPQVLNLAIGRLIGMSVGLFGVHNWNSVVKDMCWTKGFRCINDNPYTRIQLRRLDKERNRQISKLKRYLRDNFDEDHTLENKFDNNNRQMRDHIGKPFSYFHQGLR